MDVQDSNRAAVARDFVVGDWLVQPALGRITRGETVVKLRPQLVDVLVCLARGAGQTLTKNEMLDSVWRQQYVAESGLGRCVAELRQALGDAAQHPRYIETIPKRGYRLVAPVSWLPHPVHAATDGQPPVEASSGEHVVAAAPALPGAPPTAAPANEKSRRGTRAALLTSVGVAAWGLAAFLALVFYRPAPAAAPAHAGHRIVIVFENKTGETVFDEALPLALSVQLEQSPALAVLTDQRVREELRYMGRDPAARLTRAAALEVCQRAGAKAMLAGSIAALGSHYVIGLDAVACDSGAGLAREQVEVNGKERVLDALGRLAAAMRERLGESVASIRQSDVQPMQATTSSLEALKAASLADAARAHGRDAEAVRLYRQAIDMDPSFALAHVRLGIHLMNLGQVGEGEEALQKAFALRDHVSLPERSYISGFYYSRVERDPFKALDTFAAWRDGYPHDLFPRLALASLLTQVGRFQEGLKEVEQAVRLDARHAMGNAVLMQCLIALGRLDDARRVGEAVVARGEGNANTHQMLLVVASLQRNAAAERRELEWAAANPAAAILFADARALLAASRGRLRDANRLWSESVKLAEERGDPALLAQTRLDEAEARALAGQRRQAIALATAAVGQAPGAQTLVRAAAVLGLAGDGAAAAQLLRRYARMPALGAGSDPEYRPVAAALSALQQGRAEEALAALGPPRGHEAGLRFNFLATLARAIVLERVGRPSEAAAEYERIVAGRHSVADRPIVPVAHYHLARLRNASGDDAAAARHCSAFLEGWRDADANLPVMADARRLCSQDH